MYEFRARLGLDDGIAELMIYAAEPVRDLTELILDEWDRQFREHGYSLTQLDACKEQLQAAVDVPENNDKAMIERKRKWTPLKEEEARLSRNSAMSRTLTSMRWWCCAAAC